jgi:hypothetical protein
MKSKLSIAIIALSLSACSSIKNVTNGDEPIRNQKLSSSFASQDGFIKVETDCAWYKPWKSANDCQVTSIQSTATFPTNGNTANNVKTATIHASNQAKANIAHFIKEEVTSSRVTTTIAKNIEKASDKLNSKGDDGKVVEMTDVEASKTHSVRENSNDTAHHLTTTVRSNATTMLRGIKTLSPQRNGDQEISVTVVWDLQSDSVATQLNARFNGK